MVQAPTRRRFTVEEYYRMADAGILGEDDRVELIDGEIVQMSPIGSRHAAAVKRLTQLLYAVFRPAALVGVQDPVRLSERDEPVPDLALLRLRDDLYAEAHPTAADVLLIVEVAETSAAYDRRVKAPLYARRGVAELWLLDLRRATLTVCREPAPGGYGSEQTLRRGESVSPLAFPERALAVADLLG